MSTFHAERLVKHGSQLAERLTDTLALYEPLPFQEMYHACRARECLLRKGVRAGGPLPLPTPVLTPKGWVPIGDLQAGDSVIGGDGMPCKVTGVYPQGWKSVYRMTFDDESSVVCSEDHLWKCKLRKSEKWGEARQTKWGVYTLEEIRRHGGDTPNYRDRAVIPLACVQFDESPVPVEPYSLGVLLGDGSLSQNAVSFTTEDEEIAELVAVGAGESLKVTKRANIANSKASSYGIVADLPNPGRFPKSPIKSALHELGLMGCRSEDKFIPECYLFNSVQVRTKLLRGLMDTDGYASKKGHAYFYSCSPRLAHDVCTLVRSLGGKAHVRWKEPHPTRQVKKLGRPVERDSIRQRRLNLKATRVVGKQRGEGTLQVAGVWIDIRTISPFALARKAERWASRSDRLLAGRYLQRIEPAGNAECICISVDSPDHTYVTRDFIVTHNSVAGIIEDARAMLGRDPYHKYPEKNGTLVLLGFGEWHIGNVFYQQLLAPGLFKLIRDEHTQKWRAFRQWQEYDTAYEEKAIDAPPLFVEGKNCKIAYESRAKHVFHRIDVPETGWRCLAYNSAGDPGQCQGFSVHLAHIDEDVAEHGWKDELTARCSGVGGKLRWTARVHDRTPDIQAMADQAQAELGSKKPTTVLIQATILDNPHWKQENVDEFIAICKAKGDDVYRSMVLGLPTLDDVRVYGRFNPDDHGIDPHKLKHQAIPHTWTRYLGIDPGIQPASALFMAIPPPDELDEDGEPWGNLAVVYDEVQIMDSDAERFAFAVKQVAGDDHFHKFVIDDHGSRSREHSGVKISAQYHRQFKAHGLKSHTTGHGAQPGSDDVKSRISQVRNCLSSWADGLQLRYIRGRVPKFEHEMTTYKKKQVKLAGGKKHTVDEPNTRGIHLAVICEYLIAANPTFVPPPPKKKPLSPAMQRFHDKNKKDRQKPSVVYF